MITGSLVLGIFIVAVAAIVLGWLFLRHAADRTRAGSDAHAPETAGTRSANLSTKAVPDSRVGDGLNASTGPVLDASSSHGPSHGHYLAKACDLAYRNADEGRVQFREQLNLDAQLTSVDNTQAWVGQNEGSIVVAFRGSESPNSLDGFKDWLLTNARNFLVIPEGRIGTDFVAAGVGARFHRGFMSALDEVWLPLHAEVERAMRAKERPLWVTGHSLGGAIALLCAWRFHQKFLPVHQICTFGAPMIGNAAAAEAYHREFPGKIFRYVDENDLVPRLPMVSMFSNPYGHCQTEIVVGASDEPRVRDVVHLLDDVDGVEDADQAADDDAPMTAKLVDGIWGNLHVGISCHLMGNYLSRINDRMA